MLCFIKMNNNTYFFANKDIKAQFIFINIYKSLNILLR